MFKNKGIIDKILLENGFKYFDDWKYGPQCTWNEDYDIVTLQLMHHNYGYWLILHRHAGGENIDMNIGESDNAHEIIVLRNLLKKMTNGHLIKHNKTLNLT